METCYNYCYDRNHNDHVAYFSSDEIKWINKIRKLAEKHPDEVTILREPEDNDGVIYCRLPQSWLKVQPNRKLTDEERRIATERLARLRE